MEFSGQSEIDQLHRRLNARRGLVAQHDVLRLHVTMQHMRGMSEIESSSDRRKHARHLTQRKLAMSRDERLPIRRQRVSLEILHDHVVAVPNVMTEQVERTDVLVLQVVNAVKHLLHGGHLFGVVRQLRMQQLEDNRSLANQIAGLPDLTHAASSETLFQTEAAQFVTGLR